MHTIKNANKQAIFLALIATFLWSTVASAFKIGLQYFTPTLFLCQVIIVAWIALTIINIVTKVSLKGITRKQILMASIGGFLNPFLYYLILFIAYDRLPAQIAQSLNYTWPIVLVILSAIVYSQPIKKRSLVGMFISFLGVVLISFGSIHSNMGADIIGIALAMGSSIIWAAYWIINKQSTLCPQVQIWINFSAGLLFILPYTIFTETLIFPKPIELIPVIYAGLFEMAITFIIWLKALQTASAATKISHYIYLSPFLSLVFIWIILKEPILISTIWGLILIVSGIIWVEYMNRQRTNTNGIEKNRFTPN